MAHLQEYQEEKRSSNTALIWMALLFICSPFLINAQISFTRHYTPDDGLAGSEIYDLIQDQQGKIWFATENGVSVFNGYHFSTIPISGNIPYNAFVRIFKGSGTRIWFLSYDGLLAYTDHDRLLAYPWNDLITQNATFHVMSTVWVDPSDVVYFKGKEPGSVCRIDRNGELTSFFNPDYPASIYTHFFYDQPCLDKNARQDEKPFFPGSYLNDAHTNTSGRGDASQDPGSQTPPKKVFKINNRYYKLDDRDILVSLKAAEIQAGFYSVDSTSIHCECNGNIWIRKESGGVLLFKGGATDTQPVEVLKESRVTRILKDTEHNYWITTEGNGVYLMPDCHFRLYARDIGLKNLNILNVCMRQNTIFFSSSDGKLFRGETDGENLGKVKEIAGHEPDKYIRDILIDSDGFLWIVQTKYLRYTLNGQPRPPEVIPLLKYYQVIETSKHDIMLATHQGWLKYRKGKLTYDSRADQFYEHTLCIHSDDQGNIWLGTLNGLYLYKDHRHQYQGGKNPLLKSPVSSITSSGTMVCVGLRSGELVFFDSGKTQVAGTEEGLHYEQISALDFDQQSNLWISTNQGLYKVKFDSGLTHKPIIQKFTIWNGLPSNKIYGIALLNERIWAATNNGIATFKAEDLKSHTTEPALFLEQISTKSRTVPFSGELGLNPDERNILINYLGVSYFDPGNLVYRYRLLGLDSGWIETRNTTVRFSDLKPGVYRFEVECRKGDAPFYHSHQSAVFSIRKYYYETIAFRLLVMLLLVALMVAGLILLFRQLHRKSVFTNQLLASEYKALRLQMNPHFIFNTLNSIDHYITSNDQGSASRYLKSFAKLIRRVLESSGQSMSRLDDEMVIIKAYLDLEQMRFDQRFTYNIDIDESIKPEEISIPSMIIQPFVENAIWHGLLQKETRGQVTVHLTIRKPDLLVVIIEDNGIGRKKAMEISEHRHGHKSAGIGLITERISLINRLYKIGITLEIDDLYDAEGISEGTRVVMVIPQRFN